MPEELGSMLKVSHWLAEDGHININKHDNYSGLKHISVIYMDEFITILKNNNELVSNGRTSSLF